MSMYFKGIEYVDKTYLMSKEWKETVEKSQNNAIIDSKFSTNYFRAGYAYYVQKKTESNPIVLILEYATEDILQFLKPTNDDRLAEYNFTVGESIRNEMVYTMLVPSKESVKLE